MSGVESGATVENSVMKIPEDGNELIQILNRWWTDYILRGDKKYTRTSSDNNGLQ